MGTYYGYVNRDQDKSIIDWAGITKKISDDILTEKNSREARRFELDKTQNEQLRKLDEYTQGIDKTANQAAMEDPMRKNKVPIKPKKCIGFFIINWEIIRI